MPGLLPHRFSASACGVQTTIRAIEGTWREGGRHGGRGHGGREAWREGTWSDGGKEGGMVGEGGMEGGMRRGVKPLFNLNLSLPPYHSSTSPSLLPPRISPSASRGAHTIRTIHVRQSAVEAGKRLKAVSLTDITGADKSNVPV